MNKIMLTIMAVAGLSSQAFAEPKHLDLTSVSEYAMTDSKFEPSGLTISPDGTVWVVSDNGRIGVLDDKTKTVISAKMIRKGDYEGLAFAPNGDLYVVEEGEDDIHKLSKDGMFSMQAYNIKRKFNGNKVIRKKGNGLESLAFYKEDKSFIYFFTTNQSKKLLKLKDEVGNKDLIEFLNSEGVEGDVGLVSPNLPQVEEHKKKKKKKEISALLVIKINKLSGKAIISEYYPLQIKDMSALFFKNGHLFIVSDKQNSLFHFQKNCCGVTLLESFKLTGDGQEGIAIAADGDIYIAQDKGSVLRLKPQKPFNLSPTGIAK